MSVSKIKQLINRYYQVDNESQYAEIMVEKSKGKIKEEFEENINCAELEMLFIAEEIK